jgi:molybdopterin molybdotransferase
MVADLLEPRPAIRVRTQTAHGLILASAVMAPIDLPRFRNAAMDGFAVALGHVIHEAGAAVATGVRPIATGQRLPDDADAVVPLERATEIAPHQIRITGRIEAGVNVRFAGEELQAGERALEAGSPLGPPAIGLLAALGVGEVDVVPPPRIGILVTGDELHAADPADVTTLAPDEIRDANGPMLHALVVQAGCQVTATLRTRDDASAVSGALARLARECDLIFTSGGASVGRRDRVARALETDGQVVVRQLAVRPGRPTCFGFVSGTPVVVLPGNPLALLVGYEVIGRPALRRLGGHRRLVRPTVAAHLDARIDVRPDRWEAVPVLLRPESDGLVAVPATKRRSGMLIGAAGADGLALLEPGIATPARVNVELWFG